MSANLAKIIAVIGASGSGKSAWIKQQLRAGQPSRLLVWDPQDEYEAFGRVVTDQRDLVESVKAAHGAGEGFALVYQPGDRISTYVRKFDLFCELAYAVGDCCVVVDELGDVTEPNRAPDGWSVITRKGRHKGLMVFGGAQRPANIDKDFFSNASFVHCGRLNYDVDVKVMAGVLRVPADEVGALQPLDFIERDMTSGAQRRGKLTF